MGAGSTETYAALCGVLRDCLEEYGAGKRLLVGVSGGADSVCLLRCAAPLRERGYKVLAAHVRHDLRDTAERDALSVKALCEALGVPFYEKAVHVKREGSLEDSARQARYQALRKLYFTLGADALLTAHHRGDQAETVLMRLIRGSGAKGLSAMKEETELFGMRVLRPFLGVPAGTLKDALSELGQAWAEDETNGDLRFTRNRLRFGILKPLEAAFPGSAAGLCRSAEILGEEDAYLEDAAQKALWEAARLDLPCRYLIRNRVLALHPALRRRAVRAFCRLCGQEIGFEKTEEICAALAKPPAGVNLPGGDRLSFIGERVYFEPAVPSDCPVPQGFLTRTEGEGTGDGVRAQAVPLKVLEKSVVRYAREGDVFTPFGHKKAVRLSRYLLEKKIDRPFRAFIPLLCDGNVVLWIPGVAASEKLRLPDGEPFALLEARGGLPWLHGDDLTSREGHGDGDYSAHL